MIILAETPLDRAQAKRERIERELKEMSRFSALFACQIAAGSGAHGTSADANSDVQAVAHVGEFD